MANKFRILSIDGGGIRGVIPAALLTSIEEKTGKPVCELFDLIAGTSTGGILAVGLAARGDADAPRLSARELLDLYVDQGREIFERSFWKGVTSVAGLADEKYDADNLEHILEQRLGASELKDTLVDVVVTSYDIEKRAPYFFKTERARSDPDTRNHLLRDVARATSAAPTYFEPAPVLTTAANSERRALVDGGVFANNPAMCAFVEARRRGVAPDDIFLVSLGTGVATRPIPLDDAKDWGAIEWVRPVIDVIMDGVADAVDYQLRQILPVEGPEARYFRFNTRLDKALDDMDAAAAANIEQLKREADDILAEARFAELCEILPTV